MDAERIELMPAPVVSADWRIMLWIGAAVIFFTFGGLGGWSAVARIDSAVVADGTVAIESNGTIAQSSAACNDARLTRSGSRATASASSRSMRP